MDCRFLLCTKKFSLLVALFVETCPQAGDVVWECCECATGKDRNARDEPDQHDDGGGETFRDPRLQRPHDDHELVDADRDQSVSAHEDRQRLGVADDGAENASEGPVLFEERDRGEGDAEDGDEDVTDGQIHDEVVRYCSHARGGEDDVAHEAVAD